MLLGNKQLCNRTRKYNSVADGCPALRIVFLFCIDQKRTPHKGCNLEDREEWFTRKR